MQETGAGDREIEELELALGDLTLTVRRRRAARIESPRSATSSASFVVVQPQPEPATAEPAGAPLASPDRGEWEENLLQALDISALEQADLGPHNHCIRKLHAAGEPWTAKARIAGAVRAGLSAAVVLRGESAYTARSLAVPTSNRIYIVLRSGCEPGSFFTTSYSRYFAKLRDPATGQFRRGTISHGFATKAEAEAYCAAAGQAWPAELVEQN